MNIKAGNILFPKQLLLFGIVLSSFLFQGFFGARGILYSQILNKSNLEVFEDEISSELEKIYYLPEIDRNGKFVFYVTAQGNNPEAKKFMEKAVRSSAEKNKLKYSFAKDEKMEAPDSAYTRFSIKIEKLNTVYTKLLKNGFLGEKTMQREITSGFSVNVRDNFDKVLYSEGLSTKFDDEIPYDDYTKYESPEYKFTQSIPPNISLLESIIFPAAVVTVSAIAAILFFTIRSK